MIKPIAPRVIRLFRENRFRIRKPLLAPDEVGTLATAATVRATPVVTDPPTTSTTRTQIDLRPRRTEVIIRIVIAANSGRCRRLILECTTVPTTLMNKTHMSWQRPTLQAPRSWTTTIAFTRRHRRGALTRMDLTNTRSTLRFIVGI
jgi:hypothetical protein